MKFSALLALPAIATALSVRNNWKDNNCLTDADAAYLISQSTVYLEHHDVAAAKAAAYSIFTEDIAEFGDSINALKGDALGTQVENGLTQYVNETTGSPPINKITTLDSFHSCDKVLWQWQFDLGLPAPSPNFHSEFSCTPLLAVDWMGLFDVPGGVLNFETNRNLVGRRPSSQTLTTIS